MEQKETAMTVKLNAKFPGDCLKVFMTFLDDETRPFELTIRRITRGVWDVYLTTTPEFEKYYRSLLDNPRKWTN